MKNTESGPRRRRPGTFVLAIVALTLELDGKVLDKCHNIEYTESQLEEGEEYSLFVSQSEKTLCCVM